MLPFNKDIRETIETTRLAFVATVSVGGQPNVSPKASLAIHDDTHLSFANIASPNTIENLTHNPRVEANVVNFLTRRGYRFKGTAEIFEDGPVFQVIKQRLHDREGPEYPCHHGVLITVESVLPLVSPAYIHLEGANENTVREAWLKRYEMTSSPPKHTTEAYKEVVRVMLGFRTMEEMEEVFSRPIVCDAINSFEKALRETRKLKQPDEYALAATVEKHILSIAEDDREKLETLFNDSEHHELPPEELELKIAELWNGQR